MTLVDRPSQGDPATTDLIDRRTESRPRRVARESAPLWVFPVQTGLVILALLAAWFVLFIGPLSALYESHAQSTLYASFRGQLSSFTPPPPPFAGHTLLAEGDPVAVIDAPAAGIRGDVVVEGTRSIDLQKGPGHLPGTVLPGEAGVSTLLGRAFGFGGPFAGLPNLRPGDPITVTTGQGTYHFTVYDVRAPGQPVPGALASVASRLTLITAANHGWSNLWVPTHAIYVDAVLKGQASPDAPGTASVASDAPMQGDSSGLTVLVLWLQLLLVSVVAVTWAGLRWGIWQAWLVGVPVLVAVLWAVSLQFTQLLPNLL